MVLSCRYIPTAIEKIEDGQPGKIRVTCKSTETDDVITDEYNTVSATFYESLQFYNDSIILVLCGIGFTAKQ